MKIRIIEIVICLSIGGFFGWFFSWEFNKQEIQIQKQLKINLADYKEIPVYQAKWEDGRLKIIQ